MNWDDLRFVLAVARAGSLAGASRALGVNHATVLRRITGFERDLDVTIFDRTARGYRVAPRRAQVIAAMEQAESAVLGVERVMSAARSPLAGVVRVTSTDTLCLAVMPGIVETLQAGEGDLTIELNSQNLHLDLGRLDADIAVRPARSLPDGLTGVRACQMGFAVYATGPAIGNWLGMTGSLAPLPASEWLRANVAAERITGRADSFVVLREMAAAGQGRAILPCVLGDEDQRLIRLADAMPPMVTDIWVASHPDMADVPRIRAVCDMLVRALEREAARLLGAAATIG
ncbi:LysR family transcriptional regulator [Maritimibacter fusiformis]|nr:LysR family transcriptional regulator [Maritimibacter fusiformis]